MNRAPLLLLLAALAAVPRAVRAEDTSDLEGLLDESVVSGTSRSAEAAATAPATTTTITAEELRRFGVRTLDEAIDFLSMGMLTEHALSTVEIGARGVLLSGDFGNHVLVVLDGHALNEPWGGTAYYDRNLAVPLELIDHLEIILGPGSVLYGSNAMLGVINVVTRRAKDYDGAHLVLEADLPTSVRAGGGLGRRFSLLGIPAELTAQIEYSGFDGSGRSFGPQDYGVDGVTGEPKRFGSEGPFGVWGGTAERGWYAHVPSGYARLSVGDLQASLRGAFSKRASPGGWGDFDSADNYELDRWVSLDLRYSRPFTRLFQLTARGYFDYYTYLQNAPAAAPESCLEGQLSGCVYRLEGGATWGGLELSGGFDWLGNGRFTTVLGLDGRVREVTSHQEYVDQALGTSPEIAGDYDRLEWAGALYLEVAGRLATWLSLNGGARLDYDQRFGGHLSPRAAAALTPWTGGALKVLYAEAFRAPTSFERYYADVNGQLAAPDLRPEVVRSLELAAEQRLGRQRIKLALFRSWWRDIVVDDTATAEEIAAGQARGELSPDVGDVWLYRNASAIDSYGVNVGVDGQLLDRLRYGLTFTLAHSRLATSDGEEAPLLAAAPHFGNARLSYDLGPGYPTIGFVARYVSARPVSDADLDPAPDAPAAFEGRLTVSGEVPGAGGLLYRVVGGFGTSDQAPYAIGPVRATSEAFPQLELAPVRRWSAGIGLQYDLSL